MFITTLHLQPEMTDSAIFYARSQTSSPNEQNNNSGKTDQINRFKQKEAFLF